MTSAARPTFDTRKGTNLQAPGSILHERNLPAHTKLKLRQPGQGGVAGLGVEAVESLVQRLLEGERKHNEAVGLITASELSGEPAEKRRRIMDSIRALDESSEEEAEDGQEEQQEQEEDSDSEAELMKELEKIKRERALQQQKEQQEHQLAGSSDLLADLTVKRSWADDSVFSNQRKQPPVKQDNFVNDMLRSEFHQKFLNKYVR